jgi:DNA-directed RNA polymerase specialized sigma24 family protein
MHWTTLPLAATDDGWPYPDGVDDPAAPDEVDLDRLELIADRHAFCDLTAAEYFVLDRRFGLHAPESSMRELCHELGCTHAELREVLGCAIDKVRTRLTAS